MNCAESRARSSPLGLPLCRTPVAPHQDGAHHGNHHAHHAREGDEVVAQRENVLRDQDDVAPAEEGGRSIRPLRDQRAEIPSGKIPKQTQPEKNGPGCITQAPPWPERAWGQLLPSSPTV